MLRHLASIAIGSILWGSLAFAENGPGVTATEIKVGGTFPFSGPVSAVGTVGRGLLAYVSYLNDKGGVGGRKINYIALDDAYSPPKAVEQIRRLVEGDEVAFLFSQLGTPSTAATARYLAARKVPSIAILSGANAFAEFRNYPYITTALPSFDTEGRIYAKYLKRVLSPSAKIALLYQNDDLGKGYLNAFKAVFGEEFPRRVVLSSYEFFGADDRIPNRQFQERQRGSSVHRWYRQIRGPGHSEIQRDRLEASYHHQLPLGLHRRNDRSGWREQFRRSGDRHVLQGSQ